eukprot:c16264_g1_i1.p1 GENE.c16264_g1_i1~~c16264_g1_i1.p1  ORF type:complete len:237 (+),score=60.78 c16264_g1_i1:36-746(+)
MGFAVLVLVLATSDLEARAKNLDAAFRPSAALISKLHSEMAQEKSAIKSDPSLTASGGSGTRPFDAGPGMGDIVKGARYQSVVMGMQDSPFFNERYRNEFEAWRDALMYTQIKNRPDFETKVAFVPGVGYLRPFIRYPAFIPNDIQPAPGKFSMPSVKALTDAAMKGKEMFDKAANSKLGQMGVSVLQQSMGKEIPILNKRYPNAPIDEMKKREMDMLALRQFKTLGFKVSNYERG